MADVVSVRDLTKSYGDVRAVDGISFSVGKGEVFGIVGPNGAGKTTTWEILEGLRHADKGEVQVAGLDLRRDRRKLRERIGVQLQATALFERLTSRETLEVFGAMYARSLPADELLTLVNLEEKADEWTEKLSGGQRQRLAVALALVNDPEVVFLDEPTTGLDPAARRALWRLVDRLREQGKDVLLTTHDMEEAEALCDRVAIMDHGRILDMGSVGDLVSRRFQEKAVQFDRIDGLGDDRLAAIAAVTSVRHADGRDLLYSRDVPVTIRDLLGVSEAMAVEPQNLTIRRATLED